ncbi:MAG: ATP-grasp domain-containing protein [Candidatus Pacebacteria bacterium]|nr:ATP-grasp domain-containing protein [Candidatus Paceibacterota bacterium]PIR60785.1 MAG: hypothetical protein COU67_00680 [Candidatus Pacebacteria bacterium CG10_big_fil_rev_8_21_14_0_10_44_54]
MSSKKTLLIVFGGVSSEHDASKKSFEHVLSRLTEKKITQTFAAIEIAYVTREGKVVRTTYQTGIEVTECVRSKKYISLSDLVIDLVQPNIFVFSLLHGQHGEDGCLQGLAKFLGISGSFGSILSASLAMSKLHSNIFVAGLGSEAKIPKTTSITSNSEIAKAIETWQLGERVVVKPSSLGASILTELVTIGKDNKKISDLIKKILRYDTAVLMQEFISGEEYSCGCLEEKGKILALPLIKVITDKQFFGHAEKHVLGKNEELVISSDDENETETRIRQLSQQLFRAIGLRHMARFDFRVNDWGEIFFLEVNPLPGMMENSIFPKMLRAANKNVEDVILLSFDAISHDEQKVTDFRYHID